jgi:hypothetical protein
MHNVKACSRCTMSKHMPAMRGEVSVEIDSYPGQIYLAPSQAELEGSAAGRIDGRMARRSVSPQPDN